MNGSFLPIIAIFESQKSEKERPDPDMKIDVDQGLNLLHSAAFYGKLKPLRTLIEKFKANPSSPDYRGQTPLHIATLSGNLEASVYLTRKLNKESILAKDNSMMSALMNCIVSNNEHAFIYLYFKGESNLNNVDANGNTLLHLAAEHGATNIALMLKHLHSNEVKEEICNTSMEKIQKIALKSIELHQFGSPVGSPKMSPHGSP